MLHSPWVIPAGVGLGLALLASGPRIGLEPAEDPHAKELRGLEKEFKQAERARFEALDAAETPQAQAKALASDPWSPIHPRFEALAFAAEGTEVGASAWSIIFTNEFRYGDKERGWEAYGILTNDYYDSDPVQEVAENVYRISLDDPRGPEGLELLLEISSNRAVQAASLFSLGKICESQAATREQAFAYYERIIAEYADIKGSRGLYAKQAEGALFETRRLQIGMAVPDIESIDETGTSFRLSDYKGKVVLVDFWGFW